MTTARLEWAGTAPWWCAEARRGHLAGQAVLALPGGRVPPPPDVVRADGVLALQGIHPEGDESWWVYPDIAAASPGHVVRGVGGPLSAVGALELLESVARVFAEVGPRGWEHPGPRAVDVLVEARGDVWVVGFGGPRPRVAAQDAPGPGRSSAALVFRLGVLLVELLCGELPSAPGSLEHHPTYLRRVELRLAGSGSGPFPPGVVELVKRMLAWEHTERPALDSLPSIFAALALEAHGADLSTWSARHVPLLRATTVPSDDEERTEALPGGNLIDALAGRDLGSLSDDDVTEFGSEPAPTDAGGIPRSAAVVSMHRGAPIPVGVGPPPQALKRPARLPEGFLTGGSHHVEVSEEEPLPPPGRPWWWYAGISAVVVGLLFVALTLLTFLICWNPTPPAPAGPSLDEVAGS